MRRPLAIALAAALGAWLGCSANGTDFDATPARILDGPHETAVITVKELGAIRFALLPEVAPETVAHFKKLAGKRFYDGTTFHRVIPGYLIQGGDPNTRNDDPRDDGKGGSARAVPDEFSTLPHVRGTVSMAHLGRPNTAGSQFFIVLADAPALDGRYTIFARVVEGMEVADAITKLEIDTYGRFGVPNRPWLHLTILRRRRHPASLQAQAKQVYNLP